MTARGEEHQTLQGVQIVRGAAALLVLFFHTASKQSEDYGVSLPILGDFIHFGFGGVDLFFVLSGFIITWITWSDLGRPSRAPRFLVKRVIRVVPIYWIVWLASAFVYLGLLHVEFFNCKPGDIFTQTAQAIFLLNPEAHCLVPQAWTLSWEMMFYIIFALFLCLPRVLLPLLLAVWAGAIAAALTTGVRAMPLDPFCLHFILGCVVGAAARLWKPPAFVAWAMILIGLAGWGASIAALIADRIEANTHLLRIAFFGAPSAALLYGVVTLEARRPVAYPAPLRLIGDASYALYLVHITVLFYLQAKFSRIADMPGHVLWALSAIAVSIAAACLLHLFVERPLLQWLNGLRRFSLQLPVLLAAAAAMLALAWLLHARYTPLRQSAFISDQTPLGQRPAPRA